MSCLNKCEEGNIILIIENLIIILIMIVHFVFFFLIKETDFGNIFDAFESSPLFDFSIDDNCGMKSSIIFHTWEGWKKVSYGFLSSKTKIVDRTNIKKINGKYFCYNHVSYKELLYNGQIRKEGEQYNGDYTYDCGIIDTLNQHLYIKYGEKCPLYEAGIGIPKNLTNYNYIGDPFEIYYNNDNYYNNNPNKTIIGKLILNDGQPCYKFNEKLWKQFDSNEAAKEHFSCELEIFGKFYDDRFKRRGYITYEQIYKDNLSDRNYKLLIRALNYLKVSLYSREFLGIDKECDKKTDINKDKYEKLKKNQRMESICLIVESVLIFIFLHLIALILIILKIKSVYNRNKEEIILAFLLIFMILLFIFVICHSVFLGRIIYNDLSYNCSDVLTNEVSKKENENTKISILYTSYNLGLDLFFILINALVILINFLVKKCKNRNISYDQRLKPDIKKKDFNLNSAQDKCNIDGISKDCEKEVTVDNRTPKQEGQINKPIDSEAPNPNPINDLGVSPPIDKGASSEAKLK